MTPWRTTTTLTHFGPFVVEADGTSVRSVRGHPSDPDPSPLGASLAARDRCRVEGPAVRRSWLEGGPATAGERRGRDPFVAVSWDDALDLVAAELTRVRAEHGNAAIYGGSYGWASAGRVHFGGGLIARFLRLFGGATESRGTYSAGAAEVILPHIFGMGYGACVAQQTSWSVIARHTELMVCFGGMRASNTQTTFGGQGPHHTRAWLERCRDRGVRFVNVSPLRDDIAADLGPRWLAVRPGTDVALMAGLVHTLVDEGLADHDFLARYTAGWDELWSHLSGAGAGPATDATWAGGICGVEPAEVRALARDMAGHRTLVNLSLSLQRADHGCQTYWMATALAAALGQIGLRGGGLAFPFGAAGNVGAGQPRTPVPGLPAPPRPPGSTVIPVARVTELLEGRPHVDFDGARIELPHIELVYWCGGNPFHHHQDLNRLGRAWRRPATVIVHEPFWTATARRADIVLPATTPLERDDLGACDEMLVAMKAAVAPHGEARDDYRIFAELAQRLDFGPAFTEGRSAGDWVRHLYDQFRRLDPAAPPFEDFWESGVYEHPARAPMGETDQVFLGRFRADPDSPGGRLATISGRIELYSEIVAAYGYDDCPPHPAWLEPFERLGSPNGADTRFPLHLVSNQPAHRLHSQYDHAPLSRATKVAGREPLRLSPEDAAARGIADGDVVRVWNDRGACLAGALVSDAVMPGVVQLSTGAWYDPDDEDGTCRHGNPNVLTSAKGTSSLAQATSAHTCLVAVERFAGDPAPVRAFDPPPIERRR